MPTVATYINRLGSESTDAVLGRQQIVTRWNVHVDNATAEAVDVQLAAQTATVDPPNGIQEQVPKIYDAYTLADNNPAGMFLLSLQFTRESLTAKKKWMATGTYQTLSRGSGGGATRGGNTLTASDMKANPLNRAGKTWVEFETRQVEIERGSNKQAIWGVPEGGGAIAIVRAIGTDGPITAANGRSYDTALYDDDSDVILVIQQNVASYSEAIAMNDKYKLSLNQDAYLVDGISYPPETVKFLGTQCSQPIEENNQTYFSMESRVALNKQIYETSIVNRSHQAFIDPDDPVSGSNFQLVPAFKDVVNSATGVTERVYPSEPTLLTAQGRVLASDAVGNTLEYRTRRLVNYSSGTPNLVPWPGA